MSQLNEKIEKVNKAKNEKRYSTQQKNRDIDYVQYEDDTAGVDRYNRSS